MNTIQTNKGVIEIHAPNEEMIKKLGALLPYGMGTFKQSFDGAQYGLVMQYGTKEVCCIKQQPLEIERENAERLLQLQHFMIVDAYCCYLKNKFDGAYLAAPYIRQRDNGLWEAGVSHFIFPSKTNKITPKESFRSAYDNQFGNGATEMFCHFVECFKKSFIEAKITMPHYFGLDVRTRSHLQGLAMNFMVLDSQIICLRADLRENTDAAWTILASKGIYKIYHLPAVPLTVADNKQSSLLIDSNGEPTIINH